MFDQYEKCLKGLGSKANWGAAAQKTASGLVEAKRAKLIEIPCHVVDAASYENLLFLTWRWRRNRLTTIRECREFLGSLARFWREVPDGTIIALLRKGD